MNRIRQLGIALSLIASTSSAFALSTSGFGFGEWTSSSGTISTQVQGLFCSETTSVGGIKQFMITNPGSNQSHIGTLVTEQSNSEFVVDQNISLSSGEALNFGDTLELPFYRTFLLSNDSSALIVKRNDSDTSLIKIALPIKPTQMLFSPDQSKIIILSGEDHALSIINTVSLEVEKTIEVTDIPQSAVFSTISPDLLFLAGVDSTTVNVLNIKSYLQDTITLPFVPKIMTSSRTSSDIFLVDVTGTEMITVQFQSIIPSDCRYNYINNPGKISITENEILLDVTTIKDGRLIVSVKDSSTQDIYLKIAATGDPFTAPLDVLIVENNIYVMPGGQLVINEDEQLDDLAYNIVFLPEIQGQRYGTYVNNTLLSGFILIDSVSGDITIQSMTSDAEITHRIATTIEPVHQVFVGEPLSRSLRIPSLNGYTSDFHINSGSEFGFKFENTTQEVITVESVKVINSSEFIVLTDTCTQRSLSKDESCSLSLTISGKPTTEENIKIEILLDNGVTIITNSSVKPNPEYQLNANGSTNESYVKMVFNTDGGNMQTISEGISGTISFEGASGGLTTSPATEWGNTPPGNNGDFPSNTTGTTTTVGGVILNQQPVPTLPEATAAKDEEEETKRGSFDFFFLMLAFALLPFRKAFRYQH